MADSKVSALASYATYAGSDLMMVVDLASGTNKKATLASILANAPTGGGGLSPIPANDLLANATGSSAVPAGVSLSAFFDAAVSNARGTVGLYRGASAWTALAPGLAGFSLQSGGPGADPFMGPPRTPIFAIANAGTAVTATTPTSLFAGATAGIGSFTIPANRLRIGSLINFHLFGDFTVTGSPTLTLSVKLGGTIVLTGLSAALTTGVTGKQWVLGQAFLSMPSGTTIRGYSALTLLSTASVGTGSVFMTTAGNGDVSAPVTINPAIANLFDVEATWSAAGNSIRLLGGSCFVDG